MTSFVVRRRRRTDASGGLVAVLAGLAAGVAAGFLLGEWLGPDPVRTVRRTRTRRPASVAELVHDAQAALEADLQLRDRHLDVIPVGRSALELHGWVRSRSERARAGRLVADAVRADTIVNAILVHGEDDLAGTELDDTEADSLPA
jgi:hypothetical protein